MLCYELDDIAEKGELSAGSLETLHKLTDTIKNIDKIEMLEENGYSYNTNPYNEEYTRREKRDRFGRNSRYSRSDGREHLMRDIRDMMDEAKSDSEREAYRRAIKELEEA